VGKRIISSWFESFWFESSWFDGYSRDGDNCGMTNEW